MIKLPNRKQGGFTLIELLVVIAIIGLLSSIILASLNSARGKARDARRLGELRQLTTALELYRLNSNGTYPGVSTSCQYDGCLVNEIPNMSTYMPRLPVDPLNSNGFTYYYQVSPTGSTAGLYFRLESTPDPSTEGFRVKKSSSDFTYQGNLNQAGEEVWNNGPASRVPW